MSDKLQQEKHEVSAKKFLKRVELVEEEVEIRNGLDDNLDDKRRFRRVPAMVLEVRGEQFDKVFFGYTKNVSEGGASLISKRSFKVGESFPIEIILPDNKTKINCTCEVIWQKKYGANGVTSDGMGIKFIDLSNEDKLKLQKVLKKDASSDD